jgi:HEAT repeat protein
VEADLDCWRNCVELIGISLRDPDYRMHAMSKPVSADEQALILELRQAGFSLDSIWDWVNGPGFRRSAVPILTRHLLEAREEHLVEGIARVLTVKGLAAARPALLTRFPQTESPLVRWAMANAVAIIGVHGSEAEILALVADDRHGRSREPLVAILHLVNDPRVEPLLIRLLDDPVLDYAAAVALGHCASSAGLSALEKVKLEGRTPRTRRKVPSVIAKLRRRGASA